MHANNYSINMKYKIKKETKPTLPTFGKYKAVAVHDKTVTSKQIFKETAARSQLQEININAVMLSVIDVINQHLRDGDRVYLNGWGTMKLEIESEKVENPKDFRAQKHIRAVRLHFIPASTEGTQELYDGITFEKDRD